MVQTVEEAAAHVRASLKLSTCNHSQRSTGSYANSSSYLKSRRKAAQKEQNELRKERRNEILVFLDGASTHDEEEKDYLDDLLPTISGHGKPPLIKLHIKNRIAGQKAGEKPPASPKKTTKKPPNRRQLKDNATATATSNLSVTISPQAASSSTVLAPAPPHMETAVHKLRPSLNDTLSTCQSASSLESTSTHNMSFGTLSFAEEDFSMKSFGANDDATEEPYDFSASSLPSIAEQMDVSDQETSLRDAAAINDIFKDAGGVRLRQQEAIARQEVLKEEECEKAEARQQVKEAGQREARQRRDELRRPEEAYEKAHRQEEFQMKAHEIRRKAERKAIEEERHRIEKEEKQKRMEGEEIIRIEKEAEEVRRQRKEQEESVAAVTVDKSDDSSCQSYIEEEIIEYAYESDISSVDEIEYMEEEGFSEYDEESYMDDDDISYDEEISVYEESVLDDEESSVEEEAEIVLEDDNEEFMFSSQILKEKESSWDEQALEESSYTHEETIEDDSQSHEEYEEIEISDDGCDEQDDIITYEEEIIDDFSPSLHRICEEDEEDLSDEEEEEIEEDGSFGSSSVEIKSLLGSVQMELDPEECFPYDETELIDDDDDDDDDEEEEEEYLDDDDVDEVEYISDDESLKEKLMEEVDEEEIWEEDENGNIVIQEMNPTSIINEIVDDVTGEVLFEVEEEEIIPQFQVPEDPVLSAWQYRQAEKELENVEEEEELPEVAPRTPRSILLAALAAGAADYKLRKVPNDHKKRFVAVCDAAASLGRLFRLGEKIFESVGTAPLIKNDDGWKPTGKPIALLRSSNLRLVNEAAAMGRLVRLKEEVFVNYKETSQVRERRVDIEDMVDKKGYKIFRTNVLVHHHVSDAKKESMGRDWNTNILEEVTEAEERTIDNVVLPTQQVPRFRPTTTKLGPREINDAIARGVAEGAWDRKYRLERPHIPLRMTTRCRCKYCSTNPSAYQTHAYKQMGEKQRASKVLR